VLDVPGLAGEVKRLCEACFARTLEEGGENFSRCEGWRDRVIIGQGKGGVILWRMPAEGVEDVVGESGDESGRGKVVESSLFGSEISMIRKPEW